MSPGEVVGLHECVQPVGSVVGDAQRFGLVAEFDEGDDRPEGFGLGQHGGIIHAPEDGRFNVVALREIAAQPLATEEQLPRLLGDGLIDHAEDPIG